MSAWCSVCSKKASECSPSPNSAQPGSPAALHSLVGITHGIVLVTGPTGSGKTTTLYAVLQELTAPDKNILTIEDPVEYELEGVGQIQVNPKIG